MAMEFFRPDNLDDALAILKEKENCKILAGGTDLAIELNERKIKPDQILDITGIGCLKKIEEREAVLHIGAAATFDHILRSALVAKYCPALSFAASQVGAVQIRNVATIGGNVANAAAAADCVPPLMCAGAMAAIKSIRGTRVVAVSDVVVGAGKNSLEKDEIIVEFLFSAKPGYAMVFEKLGRRKALAIARINLAVCAKLENGVVSDIAVVVGAVGLTAYRVSEVEQFLVGKHLEADVIEQASKMMDETVARNLAGRSTTPYKRKIAYAVLKRALKRLVGGEGACGLG